MMEDKEGWVYVLTNEAMPGLVKIGYTMKDPTIRAEDLSKETGIPMPFVVVYKALVPKPYQVEQAVHRELNDKRLNENRELFKCHPSKAISVIQQVSTVKYEDSKHTDAPTEKNLKEEHSVNETVNSVENEATLYKMNDGGTYVGSLDPEGYPHGHGTRTYADGFKYIGNWENGTQMDSHAQLFYPDGHKYYGGFKDGKRHGSGTMIFPDGKQKSGKWQNNELVEWDRSLRDYIEQFFYIYGCIGLGGLILMYLYLYLF
jgi:hypothetical protein